MKDVFDTKLLTELVTPGVKQRLLEPGALEAVSMLITVNRLLCETLARFGVTAVHLDQVVAATTDQAAAAILRAIIDPPAATDVTADQPAKVDVSVVESSP